MAREVLNKKIKINDLLLNYYFLPSQKKSEKTLVFLHGWGVNSKSWFNIIKKLGQFNIYLIDLPGFGESQSPKDFFTLNDYAVMINLFIKKITLKNVVLIGHSFGGRVTIKLASKNPSYINKIVLVDSAGVYHPNLRKEIMFIVAKILKPIFKPDFMQSLRQKLYNLIGSREYLAIPSMSKTFAKITKEDLIPLLSKINYPTLIVWGENDTNDASTINDAKLIGRKIKKSKLVILKNAEHFSFIDQPNQFVKNLVDFV